MSPAKKSVTRPPYGRGHGRCWGSAGPQPLDQLGRPRRPRRPARPGRARRTGPARPDHRDGPVTRP
ncbi:hypothetical protein DMH08_19010 [Actinomadura sp. WAC 06369]|nr:hypothetical protein DMH08_19010 [Actinomadura sp. WAC 06369]